MMNMVSRTPQYFRSRPVFAKPIQKEKQELKKK